jgi:hypothetical protein
LNPLLNPGTIDWARIAAKRDKAGIEEMLIVKMRRIAACSETPIEEAGTSDWAHHEVSDARSMHS